MRESLQHKAAKKCHFNALPSTGKRGVNMLCRNSLEELQELCDIVKRKAASKSIVPDICCYCLLACLLVEMVHMLCECRKPSLQHLQF